MPRRPVPCAGGCGGVAAGTLGTKDTTPLDRRMCRDCRRRHGPEVARPAAEVVALQCVVCGVTFTRRRALSAYSSDRPCCSRSCGGELVRRAALERGGRPLSGRHCEVCGSTYCATYSRQRTCSRVCGGVLNNRGRGRVAGRKPRQWSCISCGRVRVKGDGQARWVKFCSERCRVADVGDRVIDLYRLASQAGAAGARWRETLVAYLRERDGDRCGICRRRMRFDLPAGPRGDDRGPSIDHMVPRSAGGSDELVNLRLAHWGCNRKRGAGRPGDVAQLALFG